MRPQITTYLHKETTKWLTRYSKELRLKKSEIVKLLVERERQIHWLRWMRGVPDPYMGLAKPLPKPLRRIPRRRPAGKWGISRDYR